MKRHWTDAAPWKEQPFLSGVMRPVVEEQSVERCTVIGKIPKALSGHLIRNGPNQLFAPRTSKYHFFDGDGMAHSLRLQNGHAEYRNRWIRTASFEQQRAAGKSLRGGLLDNPLLVPPPRGSARLKSHAGVSIVSHGGVVLALDEIGLPWTLDPDSLATIGTHDFAGQWQGPMTPHPKIDARTGEMMTFGYQVGRTPHVRYGVVDPDGTMSHVASLAFPKPVMIHDMAITENFSIIPDVPIVFNKLRAVLSGQAFAFDPKRALRFALLPRRGSQKDVQWFESRAASLFHFLGSWEEDHEIVLIGCRAKNFDMKLANLNPTAANWDPRSSDDAPILYQWRLDRKRGTIVEEGPLGHGSVEFPKMNDDFMGYKARYAYTMHLSMDRHFKLDMQSGKSQTHIHGDGKVCFEMIFAPHPEKTSEDQGWLIGYVYDTRNDSSEAVILDAQNFSAPPIARIQLPQRVPMGPHGTWIPSSLSSK